MIGYPQPSAKWMKESENGTLTEIDDDDKYDITKQFSSLLQNYEFLYTLLVKYVQATDYTNYYCVGTNEYGEGKTTIVLFGKHDKMLTAILYYVTHCRYFERS